MSGNQKPIEVGRIEAIFRYPVKSMRGEPLESGALGFHGLEGDRRLGLRRLDDRGGFPWLTAVRLPDLLRFTPLRRGDGESLPAHVRTPEGEELPLFGDALAAEIRRRCGSPVEMTFLRQGIFDEASVSVITSGTVQEICRLAERRTDVRRFRPNLLVSAPGLVPFGEDAWVGGVLRLGDTDDAPEVAVTLRDERCAMVNHDPDGGGPAPEMLKAVVRANGNHAGVYGTVTRAGRVSPGAPVLLRR